MGLLWWRKKRKKQRQLKASERVAGDGGTSPAQKKADAGDAREILPPPLLLVLESVQEMDQKPPVTLTLIGLMYLLHLQATRTPSLLLPFALCPGKVVANWGTGIGAVLVSPFVHLDDWYLYQSILSFLWKGYHLEGQVGSAAFIAVLVYLIVLSQALIVIAAHLVSQGAVRECFTGFSGVLTALKVILNVDSPTFTQMYNFKVPTKYAAWLELLVTYILVPKLPLLAQAAGLITAVGKPSGSFCSASFDSNGVRQEAIPMAKIVANNRPLVEEKETTLGSS
ncbi:Rhomboid- protein 4 [Phytophthora boehmeriae]|uniref:Rhomboid- protein 4 n=1 Tax=Phytophthora boehmeriae TaxID=109152 RepID=A0A8T1WSY5_9STRA|nr:Rhomboid- protein 4 [Phytophthora boehmeriae]